MISPYKTRIRSDKIWSQIASILVALMGCLVLLGWLLDLPLLKSVLLSLPATKPNSAVAFVLIGAALWIETDERAGPRARRLGLLCALVVVGIGLLTLSEYLFGWNIGIDQLLFRDTAPGTDYSVPGRMAEATALSFILLGTALGLVKNAQRLILAQVLTLIVIAIALLSLAGYLYAGVSLYGLLSYPATAFALVISSIGLLLVRPDRGLMAVTSGDNPGAILARRLLPAVILIPLIFGWLELTAEQQGWVPLGFGPAIDIVAHIVTFGLLVWWNAALLHRASIEHKRAEEDRRALAAIVESSDDAIIGKTLDGTITSWNKGAKALYGYTAEEAKGKSVDLLMPSDRPDDFPMLMEKIRNGESIARYETVRQRKDGTRVDVSLTVSAIRDINRNVVGASAIARDITERKRADDALKRYAERLEILRDIDLGILRGGSMLSLVETTLKNIRQIVPCQRARVALIDEATNEALVFDLDYDSDTVLGSPIRIPLPPDFRAGFDARNLQVIDDIRPLQQVNPRLKQLVNEGLLSLMGVLLIAEDRLIGSLALLANTPAFFSSEYQDIATEITNQFAIAIHQLRLTEEIQQRATELAQNNTSLKQAEASLQRYAQRMEILHQIDTGIIGATSIQAVIETTLRHIRSLFACQQAGVVLFDFATNEVIIFALDMNAPSALGQGLRYPIPPGLLEEFGTNTVTVIDDIQLLQAPSPTYKQLLKEGMRSNLRALLRAQAGPIGLLSLTSDTPNYFTSEHEEIAAEIASQLTIAIRQLRLSEELAQHTAQLELRVIERTAELDRQRTFLRTVIDLSPSTIFVKDYDARFVLANRLTAQLYNTTVDDIIGKSDADFNPSAKEIQDFLEADRRVISTGEPLYLEEPITNFAGETRWLQTSKVPIVGADGTSNYVLGVSTDITERKRAVDALREQHEFLQLVINNVPDLITVKDRAGRYQLVNMREAEVHGSTLEAMLGKTNADFNPNSAEVAFFIQKDQEALKTGQPIFIPEETVFGRYYQTNKIPLKNHDGEYDRLLVVASDITEHKNAEDALRQAFEKEKELGELKSRFVSMASHEFRTPLATILAITETLTAYRSKMTDEKIDQRLDKIREQVSHLKDIMDDVLQLARMQARRVEFNPVRLDLDGLCRSVLDEFQSRPEGSHRFDYSCDASLQDVTLDKKLMRQIVSNLVSNAMKYSPVDKPVTVSLNRERDTLRLSVRDEGIGIPEDDLKHLFEPFHRAANVGSISGTGLGLTIIQEAVELHGGTIAVESRVERGTTVTVTVPLTANGEANNDENTGD